MADLSKFYTVDEANRLVPELTKLLTEMQAAKDAIIAHREELERLEVVAAGNGHARHAEALTAELDQHVRQLNIRLEWLQDADIELRDLDEGLIDFPSIRNARRIWLCWKLGEPRVGYWHEVNTGFGSRQRL